MSENIVLTSRIYSSNSVLPFTAERTTDGSGHPLSRWLCGEVPSWVAIDAGKNVTVNKWVVYQMGGVWQSPDYNLNNFALEGSTDSVHWSVIDNVSNNSDSITSRTITPASYRYFRVHVHNGLNINPQMASIEEFQLFTVEPTSSLLTNISLSEGTLSPSFASTTYTYTTTVDYGTSAITVTPTAEDADAKIKVDGDAVTSGHSSLPIPLGDGETSIQVDVTPAVPGSDSTYIIKVSKASSPYLSEIVISGYMGKPVTITPTQGTFDYSETVPSNASNIKVTPTAEDPGAEIKVNGQVVASGSVSQSIPISSGANTISITVTPASGGSAVQYNITVTK